MSGVGVRPPAKMDVYVEAFTFATTALREDKSGNSAAAYYLYMKAVERFLEAVAKEPDPRSKKLIHKQVTEYLNRAEALRAEMELASELANPEDGQLGVVVKDDSGLSVRTTSTTQSGPSQTSNITLPGSDVFTMDLERALLDEGDAIRKRAAKSRSGTVDTVETASTRSLGKPAGSGYHGAQTPSSATSTAPSTATSTSYYFNSETATVSSGGSSQQSLLDDPAIQSRLASNKAKGGHRRTNSKTSQASIFTKSSLLTRTSVSHLDSSDEEDDDEDETETETGGGYDTGVTDTDAWEDESVASLPVRTLSSNGSMLPPQPLTPADLASVASGSGSSNKMNTLNLTAGYDTSSSIRPVRPRASTSSRWSTTAAPGDSTTGYSSASTSGAMSTKSGATSDSDATSGKGSTMGSSDFSVLKMLGFGAKAPKEAPPTAPAPPVGAQASNMGVSFRPNPPTNEPDSDSSAGKPSQLDIFNLYSELDDSSATEESDAAAASNANQDDFSEESSMGSTRSKSSRDTVDKAWNAFERATAEKEGRTPMTGNINVLLHDPKVPPPIPPAPHRRTSTNMNPPPPRPPSSSSAGSSEPPTLATPSVTSNTASTAASSGASSSAFSTASAQSRGSDSSADKAPNPLLAATTAASKLITRDLNATVVIPLRSHSDTSQLPPGHGSLSKTAGRGAASAVVDRDDGTASRLDSETSEEDLSDTDVFEFDSDTVVYWNPSTSSVRAASLTKTKGKRLGSRNNPSAERKSSLSGTTAPQSTPAIPRAVAQRKEEEAAASREAAIQARAAQMASLVLKESADFAEENEKQQKALASTLSRSNGMLESLTKMNETASAVPPLQRRPSLVADMIVGRPAPRAGSLQQSPGSLPVVTDSAEPSDDTITGSLKSTPRGSVDSTQNGSADSTPLPTWLQQTPGRLPTFGTSQWAARRGSTPSWTVQTGPDGASQFSFAAAPTSMLLAYQMCRDLLRDRLSSEVPNFDHLMQSIKREEVLVIQGTHDEAETVLAAIGVPHSVLNQSALDKPGPLSKALIVVVNSSVKFTKARAIALAQWVHNGGLLLTSDLAVKNVLEVAFPDTLVGDAETREDVVAVRPTLTETDALLKSFYEEEEEPVRWSVGRGSQVFKISPKASSGSVRIVLESSELLSRHGSSAVMAAFDHGKGSVYHNLCHWYSKQALTQPPKGLRRPPSDYATFKNASDATVRKWKAMEQAGELPPGLNWGMLQSALNSSEFLFRAVLAVKQASIAKLAKTGKTPLLSRLFPSLMAAGKEETPVEPRPIRVTHSGSLYNLFAPPEPEERGRRRSTITEPTLPPKTPPAVRAANLSPSSKPHPGARSPPMPTLEPNPDYIAAGGTIASATTAASSSSVVLSRLRRDQQGRPSDVTKIPIAVPPIPDEDVTVDPTPVPPPPVAAQPAAPKTKVTTVFPCTFCPKVFATRQFLSNHVSRRHPDSSPGSKARKSSIKLPVGAVKAVKAAAKGKSPSHGVPASVAVKNLVGPSSKRAPPPPSGATSSYKSAPKKMAAGDKADSLGRGAKDRPALPQAPPKLPAKPERIKEKATAIATGTYRSPAAAATATAASAAVAIAPTGSGRAQQPAAGGRRGSSAGSSGSKGSSGSNSKKRGRRKRSSSGKRRGSGSGHRSRRSGSGNRDTKMPSLAPAVESVPKAGKKKQDDAVVVPPRGSGRKPAVPAKNAAALQRNLSPRPTANSSGNAPGVKSVTVTAEDLRQVEESTVNTIPAKKDARFRRFFSALRMGMDRRTVENQFISAGYSDTTILDKPNAIVPLSVVPDFS